MNNKETATLRRAWVDQQPEKECRNMRIFLTALVNTAEQSGRRITSDGIGKFMKEWRDGDYAARANLGED